MVKKPTYYAVNGTFFELKCAVGGVKMVFRHLWRLIFWPVGLILYSFENDGGK